MMGPGFAEEIGRQLIVWICILVAAAFLLGVLTMWGIPKLWEWLKPLIHAVTS
jgi:hypothetical protein